MASVGLTVVIAIIAVAIIKYMIQYFKQLRLNFSIANPGKSFEYSTINCLFRNKAEGKQENFN